MGRVNYTLLDRYSLSVTGRSDGSSRLAPGHKWAFFPSVGLAWQLGDEPFMQQLQLAQLAQAARQLRHDGQHGDQSVSDARARCTPRSTRSARRAFAATSRASIPNPDLGWEKTDQTDVGIDYALFNNRISGTLDGYKHEHARPAARRGCCR